MDFRNLREVQEEIANLKAQLNELKRGSVTRRRVLLASLVSGKPARLALLGVVVAIAAGSLAETISLPPISVPNTFANGTIADADEVNENFSTLVANSNSNFSSLETESNDQHFRISTVESDLGGHKANASAHHAKTTSFTELGDAAADAQVPGTITRDGEVFGIVLGNDGPGSGLNADVLDGLHASEFLTMGSDFGRQGVASNLYEGSSTLEDKYLNDDQAETIAASSSAETLRVENSGSGHGIYSKTDSSVDEKAAVHGESLGLSGNTKGVVGITHSPGSSTGSSVGVYGVVEALTAVGGSTIGVLGRTHSAPVAGADTSVGVFGWGDVSSGRTYGVWGETSSSTQWVSGVYGVNTSISGETRGVIGVVESAASGAAGVLGVAPNSGAVRGIMGYSHSPSGYAVYSDGNFAVAPGYSKSAIVETSQGAVKLYSQESPENWFEDFGEGRLNDGYAHMELDPLFLETVTVDDVHPMKVFVQLNGDCNGVYVERGQTGFDVVELREGQSDAPFTYRVVAKRRGFEGRRMELDETRPDESFSSQSAPSWSSSVPSRGRASRRW